MLGVWKNRIPGLPSDVEIWNPDKGFLVPIFNPNKKGPARRLKWHVKKELFDGITVWAQFQGVPHRQKVVFDIIDRTFVSQDYFLARRKVTRLVRLFRRAEEKDLIDKMWAATVKNVASEVLPQFRPVSD